MKHIVLTNGMVTTVDDEHHEELSRHRWSLAKGVNTNYAVCQRWGHKKLRLHREVMRLCGRDCSNQVDHIDGDGLNNQSVNLRAATARQNQQNQRTRRDNSSGYKGVSFHRPTKTWQARIRLEGGQKTVGFYESATDAAEAYARAASQHFGEYARTA